MKMSEVFKLPLTWNRSIDENGLRIKIEIFDSSLDDALKGFFYNMSDDEVSAIIAAVNAHDTQLADIDRLLDRLREVREKSTGAYAMSETKAQEILDVIHELTFQTYAELREKYPKEEKDGR